jgi:hypothetical protein
MRHIIAWMPTHNGVRYGDYHPTRAGAVTEMQADAKHLTGLSVRRTVLSEHTVEDWQARGFKLASDGWERWEDRKQRRVAKKQGLIGNR